MREFELLNELEQIENDESYAIKALGFSTEEISDEWQKRVFISYRKDKTDVLKSQIKKYQEWNMQTESGVPLRFQDCWFDNFVCRTQNDEKRRNAVIRFIDQENNDGVLLMTGDRGTGKTHLGTAAVRATLGHYVTMEDMIYRVESSMNFKSPKTEEEVFKDYGTCKFLVIDEVGRSLKTEKETEILSYVLRKRYDNRLPTIVISNLDKKTLLKKLGDAVVDRLTEVATSIEFTGESYRILKRRIMDAA